MEDDKKCQEMLKSDLFLNREKKVCTFEWPFGQLKTSEKIVY